MKRIISICAVLMVFLHYSYAQPAPKRHFTITGYYAGNTTAIDSFEVGKLTHLIFSFCHLDSNKLATSRASDTVILQKMVSLRDKNPALKLMVSLGGWGGCMNCSAVFSNAEARKEFAISTKALLIYFGLDGIDIDWEYPAIEGFPGHAYSPSDRANFTELMRELRTTLGKRYEISFAAGGFTKYIRESVEWDKVMPLVNRVYLMSYDLVGGYSTTSAHHTPLYSNTPEAGSANQGVSALLKAGVPANKIVIGAAFYGRLYSVEDTVNTGMGRIARFYHSISWKNLYDSINTANGYTIYQDARAGAAYAFNPERLLFATFDDSLSVYRKTKYALQKNLNGIMFWQLMDDTFSNGLLQVIHSALNIRN